MLFYIQSFTSDFDALQQITSKHASSLITDKYCYNIGQLGCVRLTAFLRMLLPERPKSDGVLENQMYISKGTGMFSPQLTVIVCS